MSSKPETKGSSSKRLTESPMGPPQKKAKTESSSSASASSSSSAAISEKKTKQDSSLYETELGRPVAHVDNGIEICEKLIKDTGVAQSSIHNRISESLRTAKAVSEGVKKYINSEIIPSIVPVGANNAGKSYFVNNLTLGGNLEELGKSIGLEKRVKEYWANHFPVRSSSGGGEALTVLVTRIQANRGKAREFAARLVFTSSSVFHRRLGILKESSESETADVNLPNLQELQAQLDGILAERFPERTKSADGRTMELTKNNQPGMNVFEELFKYRQLITDFEKDIAATSALSWLIEVELEGPFENLRNMKIELLDIPGLSEADTLRKILSLDIIRHVDVIALFGHGRTSGTHDFELIKEGFHVIESATPQLIFIDNPHKLINEGKTMEELVTQHLTYVNGAKTTLNACILNAENAAERKLYHRMKERLMSFLFLSEQSRQKIREKTPPQGEFSVVIRKALKLMVEQRLKPAHDYIVSILYELKLYILSLRRSTDLVLPDNSSLFVRAPVELVVTLVDPDQLNVQVKELLATEKPKLKNALAKFITSKCANPAVLEELLKSVCEYHQEEASFRLFILCHLQIFPGAKSRGSEPISKLKEELYDDFEAAMEVVELLRQNQYEDDPSVQLQAITRGRPRKESQSKENEKVRNQNFAIRYSRMETLKTEAEQAVVGAISTLLPALRKFINDRAKIDDLYANIEKSPNQAFEVVSNFLSAVPGNFIESVSQEKGLPFINNFYTELKTVASMAPKKTSVQNADSSRVLINSTIKQFVSDVGPEETTIVTSKTSKDAPKPYYATPPVRIRQHKQTDLGSNWNQEVLKEIKIDPNLQEDFSITLDYPTKKIDIVAKNKDWKQNVDRCLKAVDRDESLYPIFSISQKRAGSFFDILRNPNKGLEHFEHLVFLLIPVNELTDYVKHRKERFINHEKNILLVTVPNTANANFMASLLIYFQSCLRASMSGIAAFEFFYFIDDRIIKTRTFDASRLNFVPCSLYLSLHFAKQVLEFEMNKAPVEEVKSIAEDEQIQALMYELCAADKSLKLVTVIMEIDRKESGILKAARAGTKPELSEKILANAKFVTGLMDRVRDMQKGSLSKIYAVSVMEHSLNDLSPLSFKRVAGDEKNTTRENYRQSNLSEKACALFNARCLEGYNFMSDVTLWNPSVAKEKQRTLEYKGLFARICENGSNAFTVYNYDMKRQSNPPSDEK